MKPCRLEDNIFITGYGKRACPYTVPGLLCGAGAFYFNRMSNFLSKTEDPTIRDIFKTLLGDNYDLIDCFMFHPICDRLTPEELEDISDRIINNKEKITKLLEPLKKKLDEENNWWRSKIPYRKGE